MQLLLGLPQTALLLEQFASKALLIVTVSAVDSTTLRALLIVAIIAMDALAFLMIRRNLAKTASGLDRVVFSRIADRRNVAGGRWTDTVTALDSHMRRCRDARSKTHETIEESRKHSMNFVLRMKDSVYTTTRINGSVLAIHEKLDELQREINSSMAAIEEITRTIESLARQTENQSSAVVQTSAAVEEMSASINNVRSITGKKAESVEGLVRRTADGKNRMEIMSRSLKDINDNIAAVTQINEVINDIASRTSLLSMNAAIEAAHAGDAGRGFAVVAAEIRKLSESTTDNAKLISGTLGSIVGAVSALMIHGTENLRAYNEIHDEAQQLSDALREIGGATEELNTGSSEIVAATRTLVDITETIRQGSGEIALSSEELRDAILKIVEKSSHNNAETTKISETAQELNTVFLDLSELFLKYEGLVSQIDQFQEAEFADSAAAGLNALAPIIMQHLIWVIRARGVIDGKLTVDPAKVVDHTSCRLGIWIRSEASGNIKETREFKEMVTDHERMHGLVKEIVSARGGVDRDELEARFDRLLGYSAKVIAALQSFEKAKGAR